MLSLQETSDGAIVAAVDVVLPKPNSGMISPVCAPSCFGTLLIPGDGADIPPSTAEGNGLKCDLLIKNESGQDCVLIWVHEDGHLADSHRFIQGGPVRDGSVSTTHLEYSYAYHSFVVLKASDGGYPSQLQEVTAEVSNM